MTIFFLSFFLFLFYTVILNKCLSASFILILSARSWPVPGREPLAKQMTLQGSGGCCRHDYEV